MHITSKNGNLESTQFLISLNKIDISAEDIKGKTVLHNACERSNLELIQYLVSLDKFNINAKTKNGETPLSLAIANGKLSIIKYIASLLGIDLKLTNSSNCTYLHLAANAYENELITIFLLSLNQIPVDAKDDNKRTVLHYACRNIKTLTLLKILLNVKNLM